MTSRLGSDLRTAWRGLAAGRAAFVVAVLVLAVGTGVCLTAATVAYGGLLRPLPFPEGHRLFTLGPMYVPTSSATRVSFPDIARWQEYLGASMQIAALSGDRHTLRGVGEPHSVRVAFVTGNWFDVLGVPARYGVLLTDHTGEDVAVVSSAFAARMSPDGPAGVLTRIFTIGSRPVRVIGVLPDTVTVMDAADVWMHARGAPAIPLGGTPDIRRYQLVGRLNAGQSEASARAQAEAALPSLLSDTSHIDDWRVQLEPLRSVLQGDSRPILLAFLASSLLVLLVACANVAMLLVNRALARTREFAVRIALGASHARIVSIAVAESLIVAVLGAAGGAWLAQLATGYLRQSTGVALPAMATLPTDTAFTLGAAVAFVSVIIVICASAPLLALHRARFTTALRSTTTTASRGGRQVRSTLVVGQLALTVVLLTGATLLGRTVLAVSRTDLGLNAPDRVITMTIPIGESTADAAGRLAIVRRILDETRALPSVVAAGIGGALPPSARGLIFTINVVDAEGTSTARAFDLVAATDGYLEALGARLVEGQPLPSRGAATDTPRAVLSEGAVKHLALVVEAAVGQDVPVGLPSNTGERVRPRLSGIVEDIRYGGLEAPALGGLYFPWERMPAPTGFLVVRTAGDPRHLAQPLMRIVREADPSLPLSSARSLDDVVDEVIAPRTARFSLVGVFAVGATLLGLVGLSGALIRSVVERQRELAIRAAIGASPARLLTDIMRGGLTLTAIGVVVGLMLSALLANVVSAMITGVGARDPLTYSLTALAVLAIGAVASYVPARRAASTNPIALLRSE